MLNDAASSILATDDDEELSEFVRTVNERFNNLEVEVAKKRDFFGDLVKRWNKFSDKKRRVLELFRGTSVLIARKQISCKEEVRQRLVQCQEAILQLQDNEGNLSEVTVEGESLITELRNEGMNVDKMEHELHTVINRYIEALGPCCTMPCHAMPRHTMLCHAMPSIPCHALPSIPFHAMPYTMPFSATQCHAMPCHAIQCHTIPCHAMPCYAMLYHPYHTMPCHTMPYNAIHTIPCHTIQGHTMPYNAIQCNTMPYNAIQCLTIPCHSYNAIQCHTVPIIAMPYNTI